MSEAHNSRLERLEADVAEIRDFVANAVRAKGFAISHETVPNILVRGDRFARMLPCALMETAVSEISEDELYEMVNLVPRMTGLPMTVWARPRGRARHDVSIKVNLGHGPQMDISNTAVVAVRPAPHWVAGPPLTPPDMEAVSRWIRLNQAVLIAYWDFQICTDELLQRLQPLSPPIPP